MAIKILIRFLIRLYIFLKGILGLKAVMAIIFSITSMISAIVLFFDTPMIYRLVVIFWLPTFMLLMAILFVRHEPPKRKWKIRVIRRKETVFKSR